MSQKNRRKFVSAAAVGLGLSLMPAFTQGIEFDPSWTPPEPKENEQLVTITNPTSAPTVDKEARLDGIAIRTRRTLPAVTSAKDRDPTRKSQRTFIAMHHRREGARLCKAADFQFDAWGNPRVYLKLSSRGKPIVKTGNGHFFHVS